MTVATDLVGSQTYRIRDQSGANSPLQLDTQKFQARLLQVMVKYSAAVTLSVDVTFKSGAGSAWDCLLQRLTFSANSSGVFIPDEEIEMGSDDFIRVDAPAGG